MTRKRPTSPVDPHSASSYMDSARRFRRSVDKMSRADSEGFDANSIAVVAVHAAIAYCDALTVRADGRKSKGDHRSAPNFLESVVRIHTSEDKKAIAALVSLTGVKDEVSYAGEVLTAAALRQILRRLDQFAEWAEQRFAALKQSEVR